MGNAIMSLFKKKEAVSKELKENEIRVNLSILEELYEKEELVECAVVLKHILEIYGVQKKKNHRYKGREFVHFILGSKHKDLKNIGYNHWENINKVIRLNHSKVYPYHKENLRKAIDFFRAELKGLKAIDMVIEA
jgi:hypothetical protein